MRTAGVIEFTDEQRQQRQRWTHKKKKKKKKKCWRPKAWISECWSSPGGSLAQALCGKRLAAIETDLPRSGRKPRINAAKVVRLTTQSTPQGATHWSTRTMAAKTGISDSSVLRIWRANGLKPHLVETFKVSRDPQFVEKLEDIVGLYLSPPQHALVLCCDEKSQVQGLGRTQPGLPEALH